MVLIIERNVIACPESEKAKTLWIARFYVLKLSGWRVNCDTLTGFDAGLANNFFLSSYRKYRLVSPVYQP